MLRTLTIITGLILLRAPAFAESIIPFCPACNDNSGYADPQPPMPGKDLGIRFFFWNTAHGYLYAIINAMLGILGIVLLAVYLYAGAMWMTSLGDSGRITKAKGLMIDATIGLIIILLSFVVLRALIAMKTI